MDVSLIISVSVFIAQKPYPW